MQLLDHGDIVMADRGFTVKNELHAIGCKLVTPNFLRDKIQFNIVERTENRNVARVRVHVERAIGRIKKYKYLHGPINIRCLYNIDKVFYILAFITNFGSPLIN